MDYIEAQKIIRKFKNIPEDADISKCSPQEQIVWRTARIVIEDAIADGYELCKVDAVHAQGFVDGVKACIEKLNEMGVNK